MSSLALVWMFCTTVSAQSMQGKDNRSQPSQLKGKIIDAITHDPVAFAYLHLEEINRTALTDSDGGFLFSSLPKGTFTLAVHRIGYKDASWQIVVGDEALAEVVLAIEPEVIQGEEVIVTDQSLTTGAHLEDVSRKVVGNELRTSLGSTLAETIRLQPGFEQRTMGGAPARPVIRGVGGDRVVILKDGTQSGDVSAQSADHAVSLDPISADEIEIARGASALLYSSNTVGGVLNVVQNLIPTTIPNRTTGVLSVQSKSADQSLAGALKLYIPVGSFSLHTDWSARSGGSVKTPLGTLQNSQYSTRSGFIGGGGTVFGSNFLGLARAVLPSVGASLIRPWGYAGISSSLYSTHYGIPPDPNGGHPDGVNIEMQKWQLNGRSERILEHPFWTLAEGRFSYTQYQHKELESSGFIGTEYGQVVFDSKIQLRHQPFSDGWSDGVAGLSIGFKDYAVRGASTPDSRSFSAALFVVEKKSTDRVDFEVGIRGGLDMQQPERYDPDSRIGEIRNRNFLTFAAALTTIWKPFKKISFGSTLMKTARAPGFEELYSEGPHLAAYSFEIGNPDLDSESGWSVEGFTSIETDRVQARITAYSTWFSTYIYARNTGQINFRYPSLFDYQFSSSAAQIRGLELSSTLLMSNSLSLILNGGVTIGERDTESGENMIPLPMIPPASAVSVIRWKRNGWTLETGLEAKATQNRLGEFETRTPGYILWNSAIESQRMVGGRLHTFSIRARNMTNKTVYSHLSRIKEISPETGLDIAFLYRLYF